MANAVSAVEKYNMKAQSIMPQDYVAGVQQAVANGSYCKGISEFLGQAVPGCPEQAWQIGVQAGQQNYARGVQGKGQKWLQDYTARMTRGVR
jgi:hypothetical protein